MTNERLCKLISDLSVIDDEGKLSDLRIQFANECREAGGLPADRAMVMRSVEAGAHIKADVLAKVSSELFGLPLAECKRAANQVLVRDRFAEIACDLIDYFLADAAPAPVGTNVPKPARRKW